jgi:TatD DNase family protein
MLRLERGRSLILRNAAHALLAETDGPFVEMEGRHAMPPDVIHAIDGLATSWKTEPAEAPAQGFSNFRTIIATADPAPLRVTFDRPRLAKIL